MKEIKKVYFFDNSSLAVFNRRGEQITELQTNLLLEWAEMANALGYKADGLEIELQSGRSVIIRKNESREKTSFNLELKDY